MKKFPQKIERPHFREQVTTDFLINMLFVLQLSWRTPPVRSGSADSSSIFDWTGPVWSQYYQCWEKKSLIMTLASLLGSLMITKKSYLRCDNLTFNYRSPSRVYIQTYLTPFCSTHGLFHVFQEIHSYSSTDS